MNYKEWTKKAEDNYAELSDEYFKMQVGLPFSEKKIHELEEKSAKIAKEFINNFTKPEEVYRTAVSAISSAATVKLTLKLSELKKTQIKSETQKFREQPVNWNTWRQFVVNANDQERKTVYDEFVKLTPKIAGLTQDFFETSKKIFQEHNQTILNTYLTSHNINYEHAIEFLTKLRDGIKEKYWEEFKKETNRILGRDPQYYDDLYFMRNVIYNDLADKFGNINALEGIKKTAKQLGFNTSIIHIDDVDRADKSPSPFCSAIRVPEDVRISYKAENPLNDTKSIYHEMGHAIHETHIQANLPYEDRYVLSMGLAETFSQFFESLISNEIYLKEELGLDEKLAKEYVRRIKVMRLITFAFYAGNSLFKLKMYHNNVPFEKLNELYTEEQKQSMNMNIPGEYWLLHHILPEYLLYVPSYLFAYANVEEMKTNCVELGGERWWHSKKAGEYLKNLIQPGAKSLMSDFSKITPDKLIKTMTE